eukprot:scaffold101422_cov32-Tisochrysis_lutea.AAC.5
MLVGLALPAAIALGSLPVDDHKQDTDDNNALDDDGGAESGRQSEADDGAETSGCGKAAGHICFLAAGGLSIRCMRRTVHNGNCTIAAGSRRDERADPECPDAFDPPCFACSSATASAAAIRDVIWWSVMLHNFMVPSTPAEARAEAHGEKSMERTASRWPRSPEDRTDEATMKPE